MTVANPAGRRWRIAWDEPVAFVYLALGAMLLVVITGTMADPDLWGHLRFGRDVFAAHGVARSDVYSFTSDKPWINHEWLAEAAMYASYAVGGAVGLVIAKVALVVAMLAAVLWSLRRFSPSFDACVTATVFVVAGTVWRIQTFRPQMFSLVMFALLLVMLSEADRGRLRALAGVPIIMALWVNLHGGWLVGMGVLCAWIGLAVLEPQQPWRRRAVLASVGAAAALATLANPYGVRMWAFLWDTVGFGRGDILEWAPITRIPPGAAVPWLLSLAAAAFVVVRSRQPRRPRDLILVAVLAAASFRVNRLDAFFAVGVAVLLAPEFAQLWAGRRIESRKEMPGGSRYARLAVTFLVAVAMSAAAGPIVFAQLRCLDPAAESRPDAQAADFIDANDLRGNLLTSFDWGEYAIWRFGPRLKVSMDGRRETVYSNQLLAAHYRFYRNELDAQNLASVIHADYVWLPKQVRVVDTLRRQGWHVAFESSQSVVFQKPTDRRSGFAQTHRALAASRCFPDS
jgi:hypothetical protein